MKNHLMKAFAVACAMLLSVAAFAQQKISGTIVDELGPVVGATILQEGTQNGTVTDLDGKYELSVPANSTVIVSCVGYKDIKFTATPGQGTFNFTLEEDALFLDDVVVIGYQEVKRRDLTGSVASITGKEIAEMPVANAAQAIQGRLPGVRVSTASGAPGASTNIRIRGGNSITQSNDPLVLIDGVSGSLANIPADEIQSIDVLKDASSTAIYGARGANGVILVTTKGAKEGRVSIRYNMYYQYRAIPKQYDILNAQEFLDWQWAYATFYGASYGDNVAKYYGLGSKYGNHYADYIGMPAHNSMDEILKPSSSWNHDVTLSGGNGSTNYSIGLNYMTDNGNRIKNFQERYNVSIKLNQKLWNKVTANFDVRYFERHSVGGTGYASDFTWRPIYKPLGEDNPALLGQGDVNVSWDRDPIAAINNQESFSYSYNVRAISGLTWNVINGLVAKTELTLSRGWSRSESWDGGQGIAGTSHKNASVSNGHSTNTRWTNTLNYVVPGLGTNHSLNLLLGHEMMTNTGDNSSMRGYGYARDLTWQQTLAMFGNYSKDDDFKTLNTMSNSVTVPSRTLSFFGRVNYSLMGKYLFTGTFRADGSSKFAPNNRWGYFPAGAFAWRISDEPWMAGAKGWIDELKYRISYGTSGSDGISSSLWKEVWNAGTGRLENDVINTFAPGNLLSNPDLKWETTISRNTGFDFSFFKTRIRGSIDAYWNTTKDLLMQMPIDATTGYSNQYQNVGQTSNKGVEWNINWGIVRNRNFQLSVNWNHSINFNNLDWIDPSANADRRTGWGGSDMRPNYDYIIQVGRPVGIVQGYIMDGVGYYTVDDFDYRDGKYYLKEGVHDTTVGRYESADLTQIRPTGQNAFPGAAKFKKINDDDVANEADYDIIAEMAPHHTGGFGLQANWKNFDLSAHFAYQLDGYIYNARAMAAINYGNKDTDFGQNRLHYTADCYQIYDVGSDGNIHLVTDPAELNALNKNAKYPVALSEAGFTTSQFIEPGGFLRCNSMTLGYSFPQKVLDAINVSNLRVYVTGTNLFTLTKYSGLDPEVGISTLTPGYDNGNYPRPIALTAGFSVTF
ncbi:MAG: TonB-dependent receptor [Bacteroidales bacterium]|nr:TonB-dependent receptor [Bacteroidales bacterium]